MNKFQLPVFAFKLLSSLPCLHRFNIIPKTTAKKSLPVVLRVCTDESVFFSFKKILPNPHKYNVEGCVMICYALSVMINE